MSNSGKEVEKQSDQDGDTHEQLVQTIKELHIKCEQLEQRVQSVERINLQFEQKLYNTISESQIAYQDSTRSILQSLEAMQRSFLSEVKTSHEVLASILQSVALENKKRPSVGYPLDFRSEPLYDVDFKPFFKGGNLLDEEPLKMIPELYDKGDEGQFCGTITGHDDKNSFKDLMSKDKPKREYSAAVSPPSVPKRTTTPVKSDNQFTTLYYDVGVYVPYSTLRKQLRRHGVQSSLILNMYYRRGGIVEIVTYHSSSELLVHDLDKLPQWKRVESYEPVIGSLETKEDGDKENVTETNTINPANLTTTKDIQNVICAYFTSVHAAILTSNGSESLKQYYKTNAFENCHRFIKSLSVPAQDWKMEEMWASCSQ